ncbi:hypothetical protein G7046_g4634 [Stylonectria norvegica]|nr:hypothetical protein G7046_g4634 [Stylonectria norvegica]
MDSLPTRITPMRVIVLGPHNCTDDLIEDDPEQANKWIRALVSKFSSNRTLVEPLELEDWDRLLGDCQAVCGLPGSCFGPELAAAYPDAKIIVMASDFDSWHESTWEYFHSESNWLLLHYFLPQDAASGPGFVLKEAMWKFVMTSHDLDEDKARQWHDTLYAEWANCLPRDRLACYSMEGGWKPLCDFLEVPVPMVKDKTTGEMVEAPFPHVDAHAFNQKLKDRQWDVRAERASSYVLQSVGKLALKGIAAGALGYAGYLLWKRRLSGA